MQRGNYIRITFAFPSGSADPFEDDFRNHDCLGREALEILADRLRGGSSAELIAIEGHAPEPEAEGMRMQLSPERAEAIARELVARGVPAERIVTAGYGGLCSRAAESWARALVGVRIVLLRRGEPTGEQIGCPAGRRYTPAILVPSIVEE